MNYHRANELAYEITVKNVVSGCIYSVREKRTGTVKCNQHWRRNVSPPMFSCVECRYDRDDTAPWFSKERRNGAGNDHCRTTARVESVGLFHVLQLLVFAGEDLFAMWRETATSFVGG